ncbi:hypothetical protein DPMN_136967 [Dreissena polymorpha]|uniref:Glycosyl hydrolase family 59 catalytic domain-containing protein n=1 Tax=Dreissena polymorpha TaxID=45954 RepID=A0A9D4JEA9_DREPO|nr:hypothetical protein DPMN_136967 [Dreissena polymorpha]
MTRNWDFYVVKLIQGARKYYNPTMDYVVTVRKMLDNAGLDRTQIVAADGLWEPTATNIQADEELATAVDIIGYCLVFLESVI